MSEFVGSFPRRFLIFRYLGNESKADTEAVIDVGGNNPTSSVVEKQPIVEGEVSLGSPEQRLIKLQFVSLDEASQIMVNPGEQTTIVAQGSQNADDGGWRQRNCIEAFSVAKYSLYRHQFR